MLAACRSSRLLLLVSAVVIVDTTFYAAITPLLPYYSRRLFEVLVPLRLDHLGAGGPAIAGTFLASALLQAAASPSLGRLLDNRGCWPRRSR